MFNFGFRIGPLTIGNNEADWLVVHLFFNRYLWPISATFAITDKGDHSLSNMFELIFFVRNVIMCLSDIISIICENVD